MPTQLSVLTSDVGAVGGPFDVPLKDGGGRRRVLARIEQDPLGARRGLAALQRGLLLAR